MTLAIRERIDTRIHKLLPPEYFAAERIVTESQRHLMATIETPDPRSDLHPLQTGDITDEWVDAVLAAEDTSARAERKRRVILSAINEARNAQQAARLSITDRALKAHHYELTKLLDAVEEVSTALGDADTAEKAVAADLGPQWKKLAHLADEYDDLRASQLEWVDGATAIAARPIHGGEDHASDLYLSNLDDLWPGWRESRRGRVEFQNPGGPDHRYEPWPADRIQRLLWLVRTDAQPWVPTSTQIAQLQHERRERNAGTAITL